MEAKKLIIDEITRSVLKSFVCELARKQETVIDATKVWAEGLYEYIENIHQIAGQSSNNLGEKND